MKLPTLADLQMQAAKIGLPDREAMKFFCFYESKGWKVGKSPMKNWRIAMGGWKLRWEEARGKISPTAQAIIWQKELERVIDKMKSIKAGYSEHQPWTAADKDAFLKLRDRKQELQKLLGVQV